MNQIKYFDKLAELDGIISGEVNNYSVERFLKIVEMSDITAGYAYGKLNKIDWLIPLKQANALIFANKDYSPILQYFQWIAKNSPESSEEIIKILHKNGVPSSTYLHNDIITTVLILSEEFIAKWAEKEIKWLNKNINFDSFLADSYSKLITKITQSHSDISLKLLELLLEIFPDPKYKEKIKSESYDDLNLYFPAPSLRFDKYQYEQILQNNIPPLVILRPMETLKLLCKLLEKSIEYSCKNLKAKPYDLTYIDRPAIEEHPQNHNFKLEATLISAIRDSAETIIKFPKINISGVIDEIESHEWMVFHRIAMYLLQNIDNPPMDKIKSNLLNKEFIFESSVRHEYFHLLKKYFPILSDSEKEEILLQIQSADTIRKLQNSETAKEVNELRIRHWQYKILHAVVDYLDQEWNAYFVSLKNEFEKQESSLHPDFYTWSDGVHVGPTSPLDANRIEGMTAQEILHYILDWKSDSDYRSPKPLGLARNLQKDIKNNPEKYTRNITLFQNKNINKIYLGNILDGFTEAIDNELTFDIKSILQYAEWLISFSNESSNDRDAIISDVDWDSVGHWSNTVHSISRFCERIFLDSVKLPFDLRGDVWKFISNLSNDSQPDIEYEKKYGGDPIDAMHLSINTIRGHAFHAVMNYIRWVYKQVLVTENRKINESDITEVFPVLNERLTGKFKMNHTDRSVIGQNLPLLHYVFPDWFKENYNLIFPSSAGESSLCDTTWKSYIQYTEVNDGLFDALQEQYRKYINNLPKNYSDNESYNNTEGRLSEQLMVLYARNKISLDDEDNLISLFFEKAAPQLAYRSLEFIARTLPENRKLAEKFQLLWDWRKVFEKKKISNKEMDAFLHWFVSGKFDDEWSLSNLDAILQELRPEGFDIPDVIKRLKILFIDHEEISLRCLSRLIEKTQNKYYFHVDKENDLWKLLSIGINHPDEKIKDKTEDLLHLLGSYGFFDYRELLKPSASP